MSGLGILPDHKLPHVPGTVILDDEDVSVQAVTGRLKHATGRNSHIVLNPQPSDDPNDPLNWPFWRKEACLWTLCIGTILNACVNGAMLNPAYVEIAKLTKRPVHDIVVTGGYNLLTTGASGVFMCAFSRKYGKRPCFLVSAVLGIVGTAIGESSQSYTHILACRVIQGLATSSFESIIFPVIGDMYFVHERGIRTAIVNVCLFAMTGLANILAGQVYGGLGLAWVFHMYQIFEVALLIMLFFLCPETAYRRNQLYETDEAADERLEELARDQLAREEKRDAENKAEITQVEETQGRSLAHTVTRTSAYNIPKKKTFWQETSVWNGAVTSDSIWKLLVAPFLTLLNPGALYVTVVGGFFSTWGIAFLMISAVIFSREPWNYNPSQIALLSIGPLVGGFVGFAFAAALNDSLAKWMSRRNNGVYEPEFRLIHLPWCAAFLGGGLFLYGYFIEIGASGPLCAFWFGFQKVGLIMGTVSVMSYALDAFRSSSTEIFIMGMVFKNFMFYAFSTISTQWFNERGAFEPGAVLGGVNIGMCILGLPLYIFGKRLRSWWARHNALDLLKLESVGTAVAH